MGEETTAWLKRIVVLVAEDQLTASIKVRDPNDAAPPTEAEVVEALKEARVSMDDTVRARIEEFINLARSGEPISEVFVVAEGQPATEGKDEEFVWDEVLLKNVQDWQGDDPINYYTANSVITVEEGAAIGTITPLVPSEAGANVYGAVIKPLGTPRTIEVDGSVERTEEDRPRVIAKVPGLVKFESNKVFIHEVFFVDGDVDFATSNIDSPIDVAIKGTVQDLFEVKSSKSITVGGAIEAAIVHAGEDVVVGGGILGRDIGKVSAGRDIIAKFCNECSLRAKGDVKITKELMNCRTHIEGKLVAEHATLIGGHLYVKEGAAIGTIGSDAEVPTRIAVGIHPLAIKESEKIREEVKAKREAIERILRAVQPFLREAKRLTFEQKQEAAAMLLNAREIDAEVVEAEKQRARILADARAENPPRVLVTKTIHPGVSISIGKRAIRFQKELKGPVAIEKCKMDNVTEFVALSQLTGSIQVLASMKLPLDELLEGFEDERGPEPNPEASDDGDHGDQLSEVISGSDAN